MSIAFHAGDAIFVLEQEELALLEEALPGRLPINPYGRHTVEPLGFAESVAELRAGYRSRRTGELVRERGIRARTPELIEQAVAPLLAKDPALSILDRLLHFLGRARTAGASSVIIEGD